MDNVAEAALFVFKEIDRASCESGVILVENWGKKNLHRLFFFACRAESSLANICCHFRGKLVLFAKANEAFDEIHAVEKFGIIE